MKKQLTSVLCASIALVFGAVTSLTAATTTIGTFTGGDPGEGLDLEGTFIYAVNVGPDGDAGQAGDAIFTSDNVPGVTVTAQNQIARSGWVANMQFPGSPDSDTPNDEVIRQVIGSIRWSASPAAPQVVLSDLKVGAKYKLQLLFAEQCCAGRGFNVVINGDIVEENFMPAAIQGGIGSSVGQGAVITYEYVALGDTLTILLDGPGATSSSITDHNAILNGFTLEQEEAPGDTDNDGLSDAWEMLYFLNLDQTANGDPDKDGLTNAEEFAAGTDPTRPDTDGDGLTDSEEVKTYKTNPNKADTDGDGLLDRVELIVLHTDPLKVDTDGDYISDSREVLFYKTDPTKADTDGDGFSDYAEIHLLSDPLNPASKPKHTTANIFTGPDEGQGLDLTGTFLYALAFGNARPGGQIHDALFTADDAADGFKIESSQVANDWNKDVNFGDSPEQQVLSSILGSIRWSNSDNANRADVILTFDNLEVGASYKLQLLFGEYLWARGFDISIDGRPVAKAFAPFQWQGGLVGPNGATPRDKGAVLTHTFIATSTEMVVVLDGRPVNDPTISDRNAIINGATLEVVSPAVDSDGDGLWDAWEMEVFGNLNQNASGDFDGDGLTNAEEFSLGTDPTLADSDGDGLSDGDEVHTRNTDPSKADTDGDGLSDGDEIKIYKTDPNNVDTDGDGLSDGQEVNVYKTDPAKADTDGDGKSDGVEIALGVDPLVADPATVVSNVNVGQFTGGDEGEGLDLQGTFLYAFNVSSAGAAGQAGDANFTADNAPGITVTAPNNIPNWDSPAYGDSPADDVIEKVNQSIRYGSSVKVELANLTPGGKYKLQLMFFEQCCGNRGFNVYVDGELVTADFSPPDVQGGVNNTAGGAVVSAEFLTQRTKAVIMVTTYGRTDPRFTDPNAILDGATLEVLSLPVPPKLNVTTAANGQITVSTDGTLQVSDSVTGPFTSLPDKSVTIDPKTAGKQKFYRSVQ